MIEDTAADYDDIAAACGTAVADVVAVLTKDMRLAEGERETAYDRQSAAAAWQGRLVKLADVFDNFADAAHDAIRAKAAKTHAAPLPWPATIPRLAAVEKLEELLASQPRSKSDVRLACSMAGCGVTVGIGRSSSSGKGPPANPTLRRAIVRIRAISPNVSGDSCSSEWVT